VLSCNSSSKNREQIQHWRALITTYAEKVCRVVYDRPIAADCVAQIMEACDGDTGKFYWLLQELQRARIATSHESPMWWRAVALQRIQGIASKDTATRQAELTAARRPRRIEAAPPHENFSNDFSNQVAAAAAGKRLK
jgi:hypothetical protein